MTAPSLVLLLSIVMAVTYVAIAFASWVKMRPRAIEAVPENDEPYAIAVEANGTAARRISDPAELQPECATPWSELAVGQPASNARSAIGPHDERTTAILERFFDGRECVLCHCTIRQVHIDDLKPGFPNPVVRAVVPPAAHSGRHLEVCLLVTFDARKTSP